MRDDTRQWEQKVVSFESKGSSLKSVYSDALSTGWLFRDGDRNLSVKSLSNGVTNKPHS